jgi:hypothetical protein
MRQQPVTNPGSLNCPGFFFVAGPFEGVAHARQALYPLAFPQRLSEDRLGRAERTQPMRLKLFVAVTILVTASIAAFAQVDEPENQAPPTIEDAQELVQTISGDEAKLKAYCELGALYEEVERAEQRNDMKLLDALGVKIDSLERQIGPDYRRVMDGWGEDEPTSAEGQKLSEVFEPLQEQCK